MLLTEKGHKKDHKKALIPVLFFLAGTFDGLRKKADGSQKKACVISHPQQFSGPWMVKGVDQFVLLIQQENLWFIKDGPLQTGVIQFCAPRFTEFFLFGNLNRFA